MRAGSASRSHRALLPLILLAAIPACTGVAVPVPGSPVPAGDLRAVVGAATTRAELVARFGGDRVRPGDVPLGEGETEPGTILFPGDTLREVQILWKAPDHPGSGPALVQVWGSRGAWTVAPGIALGVRLDSLERLNGRPFELAGFDWDYEGTVTSWRGGSLEALDGAGARVLLRLAPPREEEIAWADASAVGGEGPYRSDHPVMRRLNPSVYQMIVLYP